LASRLSMCRGIPARQAPKSAAKMKSLFILILFVIKVAFDCVVHLPFTKIPTESLNLASF
jgi:hypothetical protein